MSLLQCASRLCVVTHIVPFSAPSAATAFYALHPRLQSSYADSLTQFYNAVKDFPYEEGKFEFFKSVLSWNIDPDNSSLFCSEFVALGLQYAGLLSKSKASNNFVPKALSSEWPEVTLLEVGLWPALDCIPCCLCREVGGGGGGVLLMKGTLPSTKASRCTVIPHLVEICGGSLPQCGRLMLSNMTRTRTRAACPIWLNLWLNVAFLFDSKPPPL